jgi:hypothetical protein
MTAVFRWIWQKLCIPFSIFMADIVSPIVIACATIAILYVSSGQWKAFKGQLTAMQSQVTEMQKALTATNNLVDAAKLQAQALVAARADSGHVEA